MLKNYLTDIKKTYFIALSIPLIFLALLSLPISAISLPYLSPVIKIMIFVFFMVSLVYFFINYSHYCLFKRHLNYYNTDILKEIVFYYMHIVFFYIFMLIIFFSISLFFKNSLDSGQDVMPKRDDILNLVTLLNIKKFISEVRFFIASLDGSVGVILLILILNSYNVIFSKVSNTRIYIIYGIFKKESRKCIDEKVEKSYYNILKSKYQFKIYLVCFIFFIDFQSIPYFSFIKLFFSYFIIMGIELFMWYLSWKIYEDIEGYKTKRKEKKKVTEFAIDFGVGKTD